MNPFTILIVDDDEFNLRLLAYILTDGGYTVREAQSGSAALASLKESNPDLMLLDIMMPIMDGFEVLTRLKQDPSTRDVPVVIVTALTDDESRKHGMSLGAKRVLCKPVARTDLLQLVRELLPPTA